MKENLLRVKRLLERKYFAIDDSGECDVEQYLDVVKSIDNEGALNYLLQYINKAKQHYEANGIQYDEIDLYPRFQLYFDSKYADTYPYVIEREVRPAQDILKVYVNAVGYSKDENKETIDPDYIGVDDLDFVITFDDFKALIEVQVLSMGYSSFEEIASDFRNNKPLYCKISKSKDKCKKLIKG